MSKNDHRTTLTSTLAGGLVGLTALAGLGAGAAAAETWPDLPKGIKNGIGVQVEDRLIVGLGSAGTELYALDLDDRAAGWQALSPFTGPAPSQPAAAASGGKLYVFSGSGLPAADAKAPIVFDTVYSYDPKADAWAQVDTTTPVGLLGASAFALPDGRIAIVGGYNKDLFDRYLAEVTPIDKTAEPDRYAQVVGAYMGMEPKGYRWNDKVRVYDPASNSWGELGPNPYLPNTGAGLVPMADGEVLVVNGEVKPGLRTDEVKSLKVAADAAEWAELPPVPAPEGTDVQEGLAGAFAGRAGDVVLVAGGANFPGARARADAGTWYAHEGLTKTWSPEVFALEDGQWSQAGALPEGLAYGASFTVGDELVVAGGEDATGTARAEVFSLAWDGQKLVRVD